MTLAEYIRRRNGLPVAARGSLRNMLLRSLGAKSFAGFWQYWNPVFGYGLARYVHSPLLRVLPSAIAIVVTFAVCGAFHDLAAFAVRGSLKFVCTTWFVLLGIGVVMGSALGMDLSGRPWWIRASAHMAYVGICLAAALAMRRFLAIS